MEDYEKLEDKGGDVGEIRRRPHSYRNYSPDEFHRLIDETEDRGELIQLRKEFEVIEAARFEDLLSTFHNFYWRLDKDERELFARRNPGMIEWVNVYARLDHLQQFGVEGIESR